MVVCPVCWLQRSQSEDTALGSQSYILITLLELNQRLRMLAKASNVMGTLCHITSWMLSYIYNIPNGQQNAESIYKGRITADKTHFQLRSRVSHFCYSPNFSTTDLSINSPQYNSASFTTSFPFNLCHNFLYQLLYHLHLCTTLFHNIPMN